MIKLADKNLCSGCHACYNICPQNCITMDADDEGFLYPDIEQEKCVSCGRCKTVCPVLREYNGHKRGQAYACINKNDEIRMNSSSGGIFTLIAEYVTEQGGIVFGASFDSELNVHHIEVKNKDGLYKLRGSKYLQSRIGNTYAVAESYLKQGRIVLFSGTPCQISGLKAYLGKEYDNLIMQDIICHGVPSPMVWQKYLAYQEEIYDCPIDRKSNPAFRQKDEGWKIYNVSFKFINDAVYKKSSDKDLYIKAFLSNICLRPSCYNCNSKFLERESDITLADFWGVENVVPDMFDDKGTSLVFVNSPKGRKIFEKISKDMLYKEVDIDNAVMYNSSAFKSCSMPLKRKTFMQNITSENFGEYVHRCTKRSFMERVNSKAKKIIRRVCGYVH